jgi:hypothetical protein
LAHFLESDDGHKRLARHFEVRRRYYPTSWSVRKGRSLCSNGNWSLYIRSTTSSGTPIEPEATSGIWSTFGRRLQAEVYAVLYVINDAMMASYHDTASPVHVSSLFKLARGSLLISLPLIFSIHQNHGFVRCSWFSPDWCVSAFN